MTDIVQRLREHDDEYYLHGDTLAIVQEAADTIEALRRALATYVESSHATTRASSQKSPTQAPANSEDDGS